MLCWSSAPVPFLHANSTAVWHGADQSVSQRMKKEEEEGEGEGEEEKQHAEDGDDEDRMNDERKMTIR